MGSSTSEKPPAFSREEIAFVANCLRKLGVRQGLDDAVGQVLLSVSEALAKGGPAPPRWRWLYVFARYGALTHRGRMASRARREVFCADVEVENVGSGEPNPWETLLGKRQIEILDHLLQALRPDQLQVLLLHEAAGMTSEEIAEKLRIPAGTVAKRLAGARARLLAARRRLEAQLAHTREEWRALVLPLWALFDTSEPAPASGVSARVVSIAAPAAGVGKAALWLGGGIASVVAGAALVAAVMSLRTCDGHSPPIPVANAAPALESVAAPRPTDSVAAASPDTSVSVPEPPTASASAARPAGPRVPVREGPTDDEVQAQLFAARTAFAHSDAAGALAALEKLDRAGRAGPLWSERELLRIEVLVRLGRVGEARRRAGQLRKVGREAATLKRLDKILNQ